MRLTATRGALPLGAILATLGAAASAAVGLLHLDALPWRLCVFKVVTGWPCLTCGSTRALGRLFALDPAGAFAMNPLAALLALALVPWGLADAALIGQGRALSLELTPRATLVARVLAVALVGANWAYLVIAGR